MICDNCGKNRAFERKMTHAYGKGEKLVLIEKIPVIDCPDCGEQVLTSTTLKEIENIRKGRDKQLKQRFV
ncbi:MAG: YgiT-type zinc finger protein, partial [Lentisphaerae bacterium]|nr:YgiT-type zinc finger protein [Lentisphaerota bacterium]